MAHGSEIVEHPGASRQPSEQFSSLRARCDQIATRKRVEPSEMAGGIVSGHADERHVKTFADGFRDLANGNALFSDGVIIIARLVLFDRKPK